MALSGLYIVDNSYAVFWLFTVDGYKLQVIYDATYVCCIVTAFYYVYLYLVYFMNQSNEATS